MFIVSERSVNKRTLPSKTKKSSSAWSPMLYIISLSSDVYNFSFGIRSIKKSFGLLEKNLIAEMIVPWVDSTIYAYKFLGKP